MNPYPMLSGYAHASLDTLFAPAPANGLPLLSSLFAAQGREAHLVASLGIRLLAATYEVAAMAFGLDLAPFRDWEKRAEVFVLEA